MSTYPNLDKQKLPDAMALLSAITEHMDNLEAYVQYAQRIIDQLPEEERKDNPPPAMPRLDRLGQLISAQLSGQKMTTWVGSVALYAITRGKRGGHPLHLAHTVLRQALKKKAEEKAKSGKVSQEAKSLCEIAMQHKDRDVAPYLQALVESVIGKSERDKLLALYDGGKIEATEDWQSYLK